MKDGEIVDADNVYVDPAVVNSENVRDGDIIVVVRNGSRALIGKHAEIKGFKPNTVIGAFMTGIRSEHSSFLNALLNTPWFGKEIEMNMGATINQITGYMFSKMEFMVPSPDEQDVIGDYFKSLDNLITLHQYKLYMGVYRKGTILTYFWEQRKFGNIFEEYSEKKHEELPPLTIIQGGGTVLREESNRNMQYDKSSLSNYKMVKKDDFILHLRSFEGGLEKANTNGIISPAYHTFHGEHTDSIFYYSFFRSKYFIDVLLKPHVYGIRDGKSVDVEGMKSILVPIPTYNEQKLIGNFIERIDHLITLHQRKCDNLKIIKKSMLDNLFPKNGEKVPKWRFKGFNNDWEQRKVGDYYEFKNGLNKGKELFGEGTPIVNFTDIFHNRGISPEMLSGKVRLNLSEIKNYEVKKGDIFFTRTSETIDEIGYPSVMLGEPENTVFSGFVLRGRCFLKDDPLDNLFKKYIFFTDAFRTEMLRKSSMTTRALTSGTAIKNMEFLHPSSKEEQHKIGELLTNIDHLITLHQSEVERLKKAKQFFLDKMFI